MNAKHRIYSIPYNGTNPKWFLQETVKRKNNIDHVYCELPHEEMLSHVRFTFDGKNEENVDQVDANLKRAAYIKNCVEFLRISKGLVRRICPVNAMYYRFNSQEELHTGRSDSFGLPGSGDCPCAIAGTGTAHILQCLPVEPAANGNLEGKVRNYGVQSAPGDFTGTFQIKRNA